MSAPAAGARTEPGRLAPAPALWRIGRAVDIPLLEGRTALVAGRRIAVFNTGAGFAALDAACPHRGGPLADGLVADGCVTCPLHDWRVDLASGEVVGGGEGAVHSYEVRERDGELLVRIPVESFSDGETDPPEAEPAG